MKPAFPCRRRKKAVSRRDFLWELGGGLGGVALSAMLSEAQATTNPLSAKRPPLPAKARAVIQIFCPGGLSHVDSWDYKPELAKRSGKPFDLDGKVQFFASKPGNCQGSYWPFRQHGQCGRWISDLFPKLATYVDDMAFIHSMQSKSALHGPAMFMANTGFILPGFPSMGAWVTYGLGSESENLPAFVVLPDPRGLPPGGGINWGAGFLPAVHQGTILQTDAGKPPIADLFPPKSFAQLRGDSEEASRDFLQTLNHAHAAGRAGNTELEARISAYELAARLQLSAPEVTDLHGESSLTKQLYQLDHEDIGPFGRQCLLARRLVERGVRFVQIYCGAENTMAKKIRPNWDSHEDLVRDHGYWGQVLDSGAAALLRDLKSHGMLDSTLVICTSEFGRQPAAQGKGRDHNPGAFTAWMAGGGIQGGAAYGSTDDLGSKAAENPAYCYDLHATALHLLGIDHEKLSFYNNGIKRRLTDVHGHVIKDILA
ncbi:DUF1501 domain-containing protein [Prosthecobacter vanneervenii]|uniref:Sulfatase n=1 Tax=Prosthecobacter vanneervenii TaxID=48466 RepID=A0A7W8DLZ6_9BACT|nr:DUF1501 domain-containing protein [Prosthecobacter vanneervenii]MBB5034894.1 hypothetical protein [Prosthecobacter vanneervenii]